MRAVLVDTGPFVALLDRSDRHHVRITRALRSIRDPLVTVWPVLVEALYLLSFSWEAQKALLEIVELGQVRLLPLDETDMADIKRLMEKYRDLPMDVADAALVRVAERDHITRILTVDQRDFRIYRLARRGSFTLLP